MVKIDYRHNTYTQTFLIIKKKTQKKLKEVIKIHRPILNLFGYLLTANQTSKRSMCNLIKNNGIKQTPMVNELKL